MTDDTLKPFSLDMTMDDIEDLPSFGNALTGSYQVTLEPGWQQKDIGDHKGAVELGLKIDEVLELGEAPDAGKEAPKVGDTFNCVYMTDNKTGLGFFKQDAKPFMDKLGVKTYGEMFPQSKGMKCLVVVKRDYDKDKDRSYIKLKAIQIL